MNGIQVLKNLKNDKDKDNKRRVQNSKEKPRLHYTAPTIYNGRSYNCLTCHF